MSTKPKINHSSLNSPSCYDWLSKANFPLIFVVVENLRLLELVANAKTYLMTMFEKCYLSHWSFTFGKEGYIILHSDVQCTLFQLILWNKPIEPETK